MMQAGFHYANTLVATISENIQNQISSRDSEILALLENIPSLVASLSSSSVESIQEIPSQASLNYQVNIAINNNIQLEILKLLKELLKDTKQSKQNLYRCYF